MNEEKERNQQIFMQEEETELFDVIGGTGKEKTRLPKALVKCEERVKSVRKKSDINNSNEIYGFYKGE